MAVGTGIGLDLSELDKAFKQADLHIKNLTDKTNGLAKNTVNAFQQMAKSGVLPYVESLKQQKKYLEEISKAKGTGTFFDDMRREAKSTVDEINKVISSLEKTKSFRNEASGKSAMSFAKSVLGKGGEAKSIDNMREALRRLEDAQNRQNLGTVRGRQNYEKIGNTIRTVKEELDKATGSNQKLTEEAQKSKSAFEQLGGFISAAFAINTFKRFINQMIAVRGEFELQHKSLQVLIGDVDKANELWKKTVDLAVKSPFRVKDLVTYTKNLAAYRVEADKLYETNKMLADISSGLGVDMNRLILAFGQVKAANFLRGTELRQFSEAGVNMLEELAKRFTMLEGRAVSVGEVFERVSKRMVSFRDVEAVLKSLTSEGGTFYQMQEKQSETLKGMIMNLKDSVDLAFNEMGESTESVTKKAVNAVRNLVDNWEKFRPVISGITVALVSTLVGVGVAKVIKGFKLAGEAIKAVFTLIKTGTMAASAGAGSWVALFAVFTGVVVAITQAIGSANKLQKELNKIYAEDTGNLDKSIARYQDLVNRLREANKGSQERRDIVEKLNNEYGQYLDFIVTEQTEIDKLINSYDILVARMKEKAAAATYEKAFGEISDQYAKKMLRAQKDFEKVLTGENFFMKEIPLEAYGLMQRGKNLFGGETAASIIPTKQEINDLYSLLEQRLEKVTAEEEKQLKKVKAQKELINSIVSSYYGKEFYIRFAEGDKEIELIETILEKKEKEREIEEQISRAYKESLNSREARLAYDKLELEYSQKQAEVRAMPDKSQFEVNKMLDKLREEFELNKIEIKFKFGQIGDEERNRLRNSILNWATDTTKDVNNEIRRKLSDFMSEEEWSNFLITPDQQAQGISGIIKEITNGYETQMGVIKEQVSLKSAGRKIDEKSLEYAQKQAKAYETVADILGIELKIQDRISEELRKQINDLMPEKQMISLEDSYKSVKEIQEETNKEYNAQVEVMTSLINQKRAGIDIDGNALEIAREDLEMLREKMRLLGMQVQEPMSETTRNSINYFLPEEFQVSEVDAIKGIVGVNQAAASAFENAQKELATLLKMQDQQVEGLEDEILLLQSNLPYLQRKVELTGTEIKDRLSEVQLLEINAQLSEEYQLDEINLYKGRSTIISEIQAKEKDVTDMIRATKDMRKEGLTVEDGYLKKLQEEYLAYKAILDLIDPSEEEPIDRQRVSDINAKLEKDYWIDVIDSQKSEVTLLQEANTEKEKAIAYEAQLKEMQKQGVTVTKEQLALAKKDVEQWTLRWKLLGGTEKENGTNSRHNSLYDERIKVIDDMNKKYRELAKTLPDVEAKQGAFNAYIDAFAEAYKDIKWIPSNVREMTPEQFAEQVLNFPNEDALVAFLDKLAKEPMKAFEKIKVELAKGEYVLDAKVRIKKEGDKAILDDIQELFDQYDLSVELKKLNIPPDFAKSLFDVDYLDLDGLKKAVQDQEAKFIGTDMEDEYKKFLKKIDDLEEKQQKESAKRFVEFLTKNLDQTKVVLEQKGIDISYAKSQFDKGAISAQHFAEVVREITKRANEDISKINFKKFKESSLYIKAMGDLAAYSKNELDKMTKALSKVLAENAKNMSVEELEAYHKALERIREEQEKFDPFIRDNEIAKIKELIRLQTELANEEKNRKNLENEKASLEQKRISLLRLLEGLQSQGNAGQSQWTNIFQDKLSKTEGDIQQVDSLLANSEMNISNISGQIGSITGGAISAIAMIDMIVQAVNDTCNAVKKTFEDIMSMADSFGEETDKGSWREASKFFEGMSNFNAEVTEGWENLKSGNPMGTVANTIGSIVGFIRDVNKWIDSNLEEALQEHLEEVERLEKEYERLERAIDKAFAFERYGKVAEQTSNLAEQAQNLNKAIALEEDKKDTDPERIKELKDQVEDIENQVEDLFDNLKQELIGSFEDMGDSLANAMIEAFKAGEDGLEAWNKEVDEIIAELVKKLTVQKYLEPQISAAIDTLFSKMMPKTSAAEKAAERYGAASDEAVAAYKEAEGELPQLDKNAAEEFKRNLELIGLSYEEIAKLIAGITGGEAGGLSALQKGISSASEESIQVLTAYWNSVRQYTANIDSKMDLVLANMNVSSEDNPMLEQIRTQTGYLKTIKDVLSGASSFEARAIWVKLAGQK